MDLFPHNTLILVTLQSSNPCITSQEYTLYGLLANEVNAALIIDHSVVPSVENVILCELQAIRNTFIIVSTSDPQQL